jgi:hypothetical protein
MNKAENGPFGLKMAPRREIWILTSCGFSLFWELLVSVWTKNAESEKDNMEIANGLVDLWGTRFAMSYTAHKEILNKGTPKDSKALYYFE